MLPGRTYTPEDIVAIVWRFKWLILASVLLAVGLGYAAARRQPDVYRSETMILVIPQRIPESYVRSTVTLRIEDRLRSIKQEILSRSRLEKIINDFNLYSERLTTHPMEVVVAEMRESVNVDPFREDAFRISFDAATPRTAMIVADRLAALFIEENLRDRQQQATGTNDFLETQLNAARDRLVEHEKKLEAYRKQYAGELPSQLQANLQVIQGTQTQIMSLTESINRDRDRRLLLEQSLTDPGAEAPNGAPAPLTEQERLAGELEKARGELRDLQLRLRPEHPDVAAKQRSVQQLEHKVAAAAETPEPSAVRGVPTDPVRATRARRAQADMEKLDQQIASKEAELQRLRAMASDYRRRVEAVPGHESELVGLMRDYDTLQKLYADLLGKKEASQISADLERQQVGEKFRIIDPARLPEKPIRPDRVRIVLAAAAIGVAFAIALIGFLEYRNESLRTEDEIIRTLALPVIAAIPVMIAVADQRRRKRNRLIVAVATICLVVGASAAFWQLTR